MKNEKKMTCPRCGGSGEIELPLDLLEIFSKISKSGKATARALHADLTGITCSAVNNKLERLRKAGFVTRQRDGRAWYYKIDERK